MSYTGAEVSAILLSRLRAEWIPTDEGGTADAAFDSTFIYETITATQRIINVGLKCILKSATMLTNAIGTYPLYTVTGGVSDVTDIISIEQGDREVKKIPWNQMKLYSDSWAYDTGSRIEFWSSIGRNCIILYPRVAGITLTLTYVKLLTAFINDASVSELSDKDFEFAIDLAEIIMLQKYKLIDPCKIKMEKFLKKYAQHATTVGVKD